MAEIRVHEKIFEDYPTFRRGIVVAKQMQNSGHSEELEAMLREVIAEAAERPIDLKADPRAKVWNEAHRQFGSNPNKYAPAHCALLKRVQRAGAQMPFINKTVAIMNYNAIKDKIPVGGDDLMRADGTLVLRYAEGTENFTPLGNPDTVEHPDPGEIIYVVSESREVMCRRWNWRNGHKTLISEGTEIIVMNTDGLGKDSDERALSTRDRVARMLGEFCQAEVTTTLLSPSRPSYLIEL
jgi:DNA/RNA-binding domain of Phe-tRNA-synthetase-like protein